MRLRILVCAYAYILDPGTSFKGGEGVLGWNIVKQLGRFHKLWVLTHPYNRPAIEEALKHHPLPDVEFCYVDLHPWLNFLRQLSGGIQIYAYLWQIKAYFVARRLHKHYHFDLFHHVTYANDWMASFIGALLPIPYIRGPGGGAHRTPKAFLKEYPLKARLWEYLRVIGQWLFRHDPFFILGQRRAKAILVCNYEALEAIPPKWKNKAYLFPVNGVSEKDLKVIPIKEGLSNTFRVIFAGKLLHLKGGALAIKAFGAFVKQGYQAELIIVGDGPERQRLESLAEELGIKDRVHFKGWLKREELLEEMAESDAFLFPSWRDGGGAVVVEAMATGLPVICLDIGGPRLHVTKESGIKIFPKTPEQAVKEMVEALKLLYYDVELRQKMGKEARKRVEQLYLWDKLGDRLQEIYEKTLSKL